MQRPWLPQHEVVLTAEQIAARVRELGQRLTSDYKSRLPVLVCVLQGAIVFMADLIRQIDIPIRIDFIGLSSYGSSTQSSGVVRITKDLDLPIDGRDVIIVEDIVDTGLTLNYMIEALSTRKPRSLAVCALLDKPSRRLMPVTVKYAGFEIPDRFVVGYGLDCAGRYRELPYVAAITGELEEPETEVQR